MPPETQAYNKTGSTNGFAAYAAFIPENQVGIIILSNKWYPIPDRITAAYQLIERRNTSPRRTSNVLNNQITNQ